MSGISFFHLLLHYTCKGRSENLEIKLIRLDAKTLASIIILVELCVEQLGRAVIPLIFLSRLQFGQIVSSKIYQNWKVEYLNDQVDCQAQM